MSYKVGDWVILPYDDKEDALVRIFFINDKHGLFQYSNGCCGHGRNIRLATTKEIEQGFRDE